MDGDHPEGGCFCGAIRYRVIAEPFARSICRLASGAPSVAWAVFRPEDFRFVQGDPLRFESSPQVIRTFCGRCGTPLTYQHTGRPAAIDITTASFDHPELFPPAKEIWTEHQIPWERVNPDIPQFPRSSLDT